MNTIFNFFSSFINKYKKLIFVNIVILLSLLLLSILFLIPLSSPSLKRINQINHTNINYVSIENDISKSYVKKIYEKNEYFKKNINTRLKKEINISFRFKVNKISNYNNLFQTATYNSGIRLELSNPSSLDLIIGEKSGQIDGYTITNNIELNKWHDLKIKIDTKNNIEICFDKNTINYITNKNYEISEIEIGRGFDNTRFFDGEIKDFSINSSFYVYREYVLLPVLTFLFLLFLTLIILYIVYDTTKKLIYKNKIFSFIFIFFFMGTFIIDIFSSFLITKNVNYILLILLQIYFIIFSLLTILIIFFKVLNFKNENKINEVVANNNSRPNVIGDPLLIMRFFAFFCVFVTHSLICLKPDLMHFNGDHWSYLLYGCAHTGMVVFFILSGYLMGKAFYTNRYSPNTDGIKNYYLNRVLRIFPLYFFSIIAVILLQKPELLMIENFPYLLKLITFNYYGNTPGPIGALWSLSTEFQYYIMAPFVFIILKDFLDSKRKVYFSIAILIIFYIALRFILVYYGLDWYLYRYVPLYINLQFFLIGFLINSLLRLHEDDKSKKNKNRFVYLFVSIFIMVMIFLSSSYIEYGHQFSYIFKRIITVAQSKFSVFAIYSDFYLDLLPSLAAILTLIAIYNLERYKIESKKMLIKTDNIFKASIKKFSILLEWLGIFTYSFYVWHTPIFESINRLFGITSSLSHYLYRVITAFILLIIFSGISYFFIERPFEKIKKINKP